MPWKWVFLVKVIGKKVNIKIIENLLNREWVVKGRIKIINLPNDFFIIQLNMLMTINIHFFWVFR